MYIQAKLHKSGLDHGILEMAYEYRFFGENFRRTARLLTRQDARCVGTKAPSAFQLVKWKSDEIHNDLCFRLVISHVGIVYISLSQHCITTKPLGYQSHEISYTQQARCSPYRVCNV